MSTVVLINPPIPGKKPSLKIPSLGIAYLASTLRNQGISIKIIDAPSLNLDTEAVSQEVLILKPEIIGITATTPLSNSADQLASNLRKHAKWLILGGPHPSAVGNKIFEECPDLDFGFRGEAEEVFPELVKKLLAGEKNFEMPGVIWPGHSAEPALIPELDHIPQPAFDLLPMKSYRHPLSPGQRVATMITSRGCPFQCIFCDKSICGTRFRPRSPDNVLSEIEELYHNFGVRVIIFYDDLFTLDPERVLEICQQILARGIKIKWKCEGRVNILSENILGVMRRAGCEVIAFGIESCHQKTLDWLNKGTSVEQIKEAVRLTKQAGIKVLGYFIFGIPIESYEEELASIEFAIQLELDYVQFGSLSPFPGTKLYDLAIEKGWYQQAKGPAPEEYGERRPLIITDYWTEERLTQILKQAYRRFYFRPKYILGSALRPRGILDLAKSGLRLTGWLTRLE